MRSVEEEFKHIFDRLDEAARLTIETAHKLSFETERAKELAAADRVQVSRLIVLVQRLLESTDRLEQTSHHVAEDLAASIVRADEAPPDIPGAGADAALRSENTAAEIAVTKNNL